VDVIRNVEENDMASQRWVGNQAFDHVVQKIIIEMQQSALSCELVNKTSHHLGDVDIAFLTFEKYYLRNSSRTSLSVLVVGEANAIKVDAASSGGGEKLLFKFDWGSSSNFIGQLNRILISLGFRTVS
jgi:hypothetical protein